MPLGREATGAEIARAFRLSIPVMMAYVPLGIAFGVYLVGAGINWYWAPLSALMIFAGSIEFLAVSFIVAGLPLTVVAWTAFIVNFRHVFYGLTFPLSRLRTLPQRAYGILALTDETYGITSAGEGRALSGLGITALQIISHFWWIGGAFLGAAIGSVIPPHITGFEFALTGMFVVLAVEALKHARSLVLPVYALVSVVAAFAAEIYIGADTFLIFGLLVYLSLITFDYLRMDDAAVPASQAAAETVGGDEDGRDGE